MGKHEVRDSFHSDLARRSQEALRQSVEAMAKSRKRQIARMVWLEDCLCSHPERIQVLRVQGTAPPFHFLLAVEGKKHPGSEGEDCFHSDPNQIQVPP
jgi:hypothetical protein